MVIPNRDNIIKWDLRFLRLADHISQWSKDPSTKTGAVIVDQNRRIISTGFNGLPQGVIDLPQRYMDRDEKYGMIMHADLNAILFAGRNLMGCTLYTMPIEPCDRCAAAICQSGITRVLSICLTAEIALRWETFCQRARTMLAERNIRQEWYDEYDVFPERLVSDVGTGQQA